MISAALLPIAAAFALIIATMRGIEAFESHVSRG